MVLSLLRRCRLEGPRRTEHPMRLEPESPPVPLNPFTVSERLAHSRKETTWMKRTFIRYDTKPGRAEENQRLIEGVFQELHAKAPSGVRVHGLKARYRDIRAFRGGRRR